jgi:hypothetical protein
MKPSAERLGQRDFVDGTLRGFFVGKGAALARMQRPASIWELLIMQHCSNLLPPSTDLECWIGRAAPLARVDQRFFHKLIDWIWSDSLAGV